MTPPAPALTLAVLTGGASRRMGGDKALLEAGGMPLAGRPVAALRSRVDEVLLVGRAIPGVPGRLIEDALPKAGPLAGVVAALIAARGDVAVAACDMPALVPELIDVLVAQLRAGEALAALCLRDGRPEPLPVVLRAAAATPLGAALRSGVRGLGQALLALDPVLVAEADWRAVDPGGISFENWNSPGDVRAL